MTYLIRIAGPADRLGEVVAFSGSFAPPGWALAHGDLLNIANHPDLFAVLGTTHGGDGTTTFALPDLRGRIVIGTGHAPELTDRTLGTSFGAEEVTLTEAQMAAHDHTVSGGTTGTTGASDPFDNMQPSVALNHLMPLTVAVTGAIAGQVRVFAGSSAPPTHAPADGWLLSASEYPDLFAALGATFGGDGIGEFALPDLRGRAAISVGQGFGQTLRVLGDAPGSEMVTQGTDQLASHSHTLPSSEPTGTTGGGQPIDVMQPSLTLNYIIAADALLFEFPHPAEDPVEGVFVGQIALFAGTDVPEGWVLADGSLRPVSQHTGLFALLGTTFGGDGKTTFALPDLRGTAIMGRGEGPGLPLRVAGEFAGAETVTLSIDQLPAHDHTFSPELLAIAQAQDAVEDLVDQGVLNEGQGNALLSKLEAALASLAKGNTNAACGQLQAFITQVNSLVDEGILPPAEGQVLVDYAATAMSSIGC